MSMTAEKIDYGMIPVLEVARELLGQESKDRSTSVEKHFDGHSGLFVNIHKNRWFSHGAGRGGDAISLVRDINQCDFPGALGWLRQHGFAAYVGEKRQPRRIVAEYEYVSEDGEVLYQVVRYQPKDFRQRRSNGNGGWIWKGPERPVPYRLPELLKSGEAPVLIPGGEKDVDNLRGLGFTATCNHGDEGKWWPELSSHLNGRRVFILCDNDRQGEKHQEVVASALNGIASEIRVVRFPELPEGGDVSDIMKARFDARVDTDAIKSELALRFRDAPAWEPKPTAAPTADPTAEAEARWPVMGGAAYYGLAGDVVKTIAPHSEADPAAILLQTLAVAGNIFGRNVYYQVATGTTPICLLISSAKAPRRGRERATAE